MHRSAPDLSVQELERTAGLIRCDIIEMITEAGSGHPGGSLSAADIVTALYFRILRIHPSNPQWEDRDRLILSKGHASPVWYAALAERGFFDRKHLCTLRKIGSILQGHANMRKTPGVDMSEGSLGNGLSVGVGMALGAKHLGKDFHVWVVLGDGELQEGAVWEAAMAAAKWRLNNLTVILDFNGIQDSNFVQVTMPIDPVRDKWEAFNWHVVEMDGHSMAEIVSTLEAVRETPAGPTMVIAHTVKGKGVSFMENDPQWHGKAPCQEEARRALKEIREDLARCERGQHS
jgi:transketolase